MTIGLSTFNLDHLYFWRPNVVPNAHDSLISYLVVVIVGLGDCLGTIWIGVMMRGGGKLQSRVGGFDGGIGCKRWVRAVLGTV